MDGALSDAELNEFQVFQNLLFGSILYCFEHFKNFKYILGVAFNVLVTVCIIWNDVKQIQCFNAPLQPAEIAGVKRVVQEKLPNGVNHLGLTLSGFLFLHALFIEKGRLETTWTVLRKFGYDDAIKLSGNFLPVPAKRAPDQVSTFG